MSTLKTYLKDHYLTTVQFAAACSVSPATLTELVNEGLVPAPSYTVTDHDVLISKAFGELPASGADPGRYYHPGNAVWVGRAQEARTSSGTEQAHLDLSERFRRRFSDALKDLDRTLFRLTDSFTDSGEVISSGLSARSESAWSAHISGVFGLCVAYPSSEESIARKEVLQEALSEFRRSKLGAELGQKEIDQVVDLIDQYAEASMPFAPPEYPISSRKSLVDDLRVSISAR